LKLAVVLVSAKPGEKLALTEKLILEGILPRSGEKLKNCSSKSPSPTFRSIRNSAGTSELFLSISSRVTVFVTSTSPKSIYGKLLLIYGYFPTALNLITRCSSPSTYKTTVPTITDASLGLNYNLN
jgi:hypothetical protein